MTKKRVVYVEGPDGCGKSTLISAIQREGDLIIHNGVYASPEIAYSTYIDQLKSFGKSPYKRLILDRGVLSEIVYGKVIRHHQPNVVQLKIIIDLVQGYDYDIIICLPPFGRAVITWAKRIEDEYVNQFEEYVTIYEMFQRLPQEVTDTIVHDYTSNNQEIIDHVNR
jgi:thymidylate kinase